MGYEDVKTLVTDISILCSLSVNLLEAVDIIDKRADSAVLDFSHYSDCAICYQVM